jgi:hypothetical protein
MGVEIVNSLPEDQWRVFVDKHPKGNIFHTPEMFQVYARAKGHAPELWAAVNAGLIEALFIPVHIRLRNGPLSRLTTRSISFGSVLSIPGDAGWQALRLLLQEYKKAARKRTLFTELRNLTPLGNSLLVLLDEGFSYEEHLNFLINLDMPAKAVFENIGKRTRHNIRKALGRKEVLVEEICTKAELRDFYQILDVTYRGAHVPLADQSLFEAAFDILVPRGMARFTNGMAGGTAVGASVVLLYKDIVFGWYGGTDRAIAPGDTNALVTWEELRWGAEHGFKQYDFGGAGKPNQKYGVRDFKAKFGGELVSYGRNVWVPNRTLIRLSELGYSTLRRFLY